MAQSIPAYQVTLSERALSELIQIAKTIRRRSPQNALLVRDRIRAAIDGLGTFPDRFRVGGATRGGTPIYVLTVSPFLIYYRVDHVAMAVFVLRILHGARRQPRQF